MLRVYNKEVAAIFIFVATSLFFIYAPAAGVPFVSPKGTKSISA